MIKQNRRIVTILLLLFVFTSMYSQKTIVGVVSNKHNEPLSNVRVKSKDNSQGILTNAKGEYSIEVLDTCNVLRFSWLTLSFEEMINGRTVINKQMTENQISRERIDYRYNIMLNAGAAAVWGSISGSILLTNIISVDIGLGLGNIYAGTTFYLKSPFNNSDWQPYVGANIAYFEEFMGPVSTLVYIPTGFRFLNYRGTSISFEIALLVSNNDRFLIESPVWGGIRFGKYF